MYIQCTGKFKSRRETYLTTHRTTCNGALHTPRQRSEPPLKRSEPPLTRHSVASMSCRCMYNGSSWAWGHHRSKCGTRSAPGPWLAIPANPLVPLRGSMHVVRFCLCYVCVMMTFIDNRTIAHTCMTFVTLCVMTVVSTYDNQTMSQL